MIQKICDITGKKMAENDLDFGQAVNALHILDKDGVRSQHVIHVQVRHTGQFSGDPHISREGMEALLMGAAESLPKEGPGKVPEAATAKPEGDDGGGESPEKPKTGKTLNR